MLTKSEMKAQLNIHEHTLVRWAQFGIVTRHAYNGYAYLYEPPGPNPPTKKSSRWDQLVDRARATDMETAENQDAPTDPEEV